LRSTSIKIRKKNYGDADVDFPQEEISMWYHYGSLFLLVFILLSFFYAVIALCDIPYQIAKKRNHPQQDAIHVAGWVSLLTLHLNINEL